MMMCTSLIGVILTSDGARTNPRCISLGRITCSRSRLSPSWQLQETVDVRVLYFVGEPAPVFAGGDGRSHAVNLDRGQGADIQNVYDCGSARGEGPCDAAQMGGAWAWFCRCG